MPLGGATVLWNETTPADADNAGAGAGVIRSLETSVRIGLGSEHNWPSSGGANTGYHLFGSARPFYDVQSNVSSSGSDGRLLLTSDTSRLFGVGSGGTVFLGGSRSVEHGDYPLAAAPQTAQWILQSGKESVIGINPTIVTFATTYGAVPVITTSVQNPNIGSANSWSAQIYNVLAGGFRILLTGSSITAGSSVSVNWMSIGTISY